MSKALLVFPYQIEDEEFEEIIDRFEQQGYVIFNFNGVDSDFNIQDLPLYIEYAKDQVDFELNRIGVLSNVREIIFPWYRCYNSLVDDFVYFIDDNVFKDEFFEKNKIAAEIHKKLTNFIGIDQETIQGKIYLNLNFDNYDLLFDFMVRNCNFKYFDKLSNFGFGNKVEKSKIKKTYQYQGRLFKFELGEKENNLNEILLEGEFETNINLNYLIEELVKELYFVPFITVESCGKLDKKKEMYFFKNLFEDIAKIDLNFQKKIFDDIIDYIKCYNLNFRKKISLLSLLVMLKVRRNSLSKFIMKTLLEDKEHIKYHYSMLYNILFYRNYDDLNIYDNYYKDKRSILKKIAKYFEKNLKFPKIRNSKRNKKHIAFVTDQLLGLNHSPTKIILNYAKKLKKIYPEYEVKIFVEDNLFVNNSEIIFPYFYNSVESKKCKAKHQKYLSEVDVQIYYSNTNDNKKNRVRELIKKIINFSPEVILTISDLSLSLEILYTYYPIVYMAVSSYYCVSQADVYLYGDKRKIIQDNKNYGALLDPDDIYQFDYGFEFGEASTNIKRSDYNINDKDFVMVTVGNRLDVELDSDKRFVDAICDLLIYNKEIKWIIVGKKELDYLSNKYNKLLGNKIIRIEYEKDLFALYQICDIYINPDRDGGGYSIGMAMKEGLPIVNFGKPSDGANWVGENNCVNNNMQDYINEIIQLFNDSDYRKRKGLTMKRRIKEEFSLKSSIKQLCEIFGIAKKKFKKRL